MAVLSVLCRHSFRFCLNPVFEWFFYLTLLTISGKAELNPFRFRSILFPVKNFFYNSSSWQFVTLNIWIGSNFYGCSVSFMSAFFPLLPDSCFWMIFCSLYWFESVKTIRNEEVQSKCEFILIGQDYDIKHDLAHRLFIFRLGAVEAGLQGAIANPYHKYRLDHDFAI